MWLTYTLKSLLVSIPYRQARNYEWDHYYGKFEWFQFLIGRLATVICASMIILYITFQFLIGRLATCHAVLLYQLQMEQRFQFLIGRLATKWQREENKLKKSCFNSLQVGSQRGKSTRKEVGLTLVSIPYRQARNAVIVSALMIAEASFNSLQVGSQQKAGKQSLPAKKMFQFLIGRLATKRIKLLPQILQTMFQFLIGRLATQQVL